MSSPVAAARYGKDNVRVYKVHRDEKTGVQTVVEMTVCVLLEGDIDTSYTKADNSVIVATDSIKNTIYITAKQNPVTPPELFGSILGSHFITKYNHIHAAHVNIITHRWTRMTIDGKPHPHSFLRDGEETRNVQVDVVEGKGVDITSSLAKLTVLKSTNSQFWGFLRDEYTTLPETWDRILSTDVDASWQWRRFNGLDEVRATVPQFDATWSAARDITLKTFAEDNSASVQNTMYKMAELILARQPLLETVEYSLPNKHYFEVDLSWHKGLKNTGKDAEVYAPQTNPNGLIKCTVGRNTKAKL
ncbi:urate oxidase [Aspergillus neoniger CBS 115656]|uniref:Uricase n=2 Tax=Aspergillus subgen. Circumdati TaxID=2720871 RepID=A0A318YN10_ASPNB|nr:urate oxidase UaZ [Aspergillus neoniger CBS 115656]XP_025544094.1 urate oxidase UaZ [Aspergillus costaricaensis CBS 115574]PYH35981.1 urate oxidase UaZ [Aspergillus neoniger CBS 115656]RAK93259.1 urate oxidase UaZ [Aspergillus costaricaensis CBS 115574]